jgi:hypothetical protein
MLPGGPEGRLPRYRLGPGIDQPVSDLCLFGPERDETPTYHIGSPVTGVRRLADYEDELGRCDIVARGDLGLFLEPEMFRKPLPRAAQAISSAHVSLLRALSLVFSVGSPRNSAFLKRSGHVKCSGETVVLPAASGLAAVVLRRLKAWGVALRRLDGPDKIGLSQFTRSEIKGLCFFLNLLHVHGIPPTFFDLMSAVLETISRTTTNRRIHRHRKTCK